jgi:hypothetical protein
LRTYLPVQLVEHGFELIGWWGAGVVPIHHLLVACHEVDLPNFLALGVALGIALGVFLRVERLRSKAAWSRAAADRPSQRRVLMEALVKGECKEDPDERRKD